jgi:hypothetical protein
VEMAPADAGGLTGAADVLKLIGQGKHRYSGSGKFLSGAPDLLLGKLVDSTSPAYHRNGGMAPV